MNEQEKTPLNLELIQTYGFEERTYKPDCDDISIEFTLPNGVILEGMTVCCNQPTKTDNLDGFDGFLTIETKEELDKINSMSYEEVCKMIAKEHEDFKIEDYI